MRSLRRALPALVFVVVACTSPDVALPPAGQAPASSAETAAARPAAQHCKEAESGGNKDNAPLKIRLCVSDTTPRVGEKIVFTVDATDPDARLSRLGTCNPSKLTFGDEEMQCMVMPACAASSGPTAKEEGVISAQRTHAYKKAGTYTAHLELRSGSLCPHPYASAAEVRMKIRVRPAR